MKSGVLQRFNPLIHIQGADGKWNRYTGKYAWDHTYITPQPANKFGGTGNPKDETMFQVYDAAPNVDHTNERVREVCVRYVSLSFG
jgi:hypothetical protein